MSVFYELLESVEEFYNSIIQLVNTLILPSFKFFNDLLISFYNNDTTHYIGVLISSIFIVLAITYLLKTLKEVL